MLHVYDGTLQLFKSETWVYMFNIKDAFNVLREKEKSLW